MESVLDDFEKNYEKRMSEEISLAEYLELNKPKHKYYATRTEVDGIWFASKKEAARYCQLKILEQAGKIKNLTLQPEFPLIVNEQKICTYRGDFSYIEFSTGEAVVEDAKGYRTKEYLIKKKLFTALYGRTIKEV